MLNISVKPIIYGTKDGNPVLTYPRLKLPLSKASVPISQITAKPVVFGNKDGVNGILIPAKLMTQFLISSRASIQFMGQSKISRGLTILFIHYKREQCHIR